MASIHFLVMQIHFTFSVAWPALLLGSHRPYHVHFSCYLLLGLVAFDNARGFFFFFFFFCYEERRPSLGPWVINILSYYMHLFSLSSLLSLFDFD